MSEASEPSVVNENEYNMGISPSKIRDAFEYGLKRKAIVGNENVFDFSIGNPTIPCPKELNETLIKLLQTQPDNVIHGYSSARGDPGFKKAIVDNLNETYQTHFTPENIFITCGAAPALAGTIKAIAKSKEDEFIIFAPYFPEYKVFTLISPCTVVEVPADIPNFQINFDEFTKRITPKTKAIIINSPNNPSGTVYTEETLKKLAEILKQKEAEFKTHIYLISDEPYREILFDGLKYPFVTNFYDNSIVCYSFSKCMSIPGERIGYALVSPDAYQSKRIIDAIAGAERIIGHVCAPTLMQKAITSIIGHYSNMKEYEDNRNVLHKGLTELGYECNYPKGSFYMFLKALEPDDDQFALKAREFDIILVPAKGFGCPGYVRLAFCVKTEMIERCFGAFKKLKEYYDNKK